MITWPSGLPLSWAPQLDVQLSDDVYVTFTHHSAEHHPDAPDPSGGWLIHRRRESDVGWCIGAFEWWCPESERVVRPIWSLQSLDPLHISPSFLCHCGFHGFILQGKWVPA